MPRRSGDIGAPADAFIDGRFPDGRLRRNAPVGASEMATVARRLRARLEELGLPITRLADAAGLDRGTIHGLLAGRVYIDVVTLARLEHALGCRLWASERVTD